MLRGSFPSAGKKSGVIWCLGGAIINKIAFLLISLLIQKSPFRTHQTVAQSVETWPGNRRVDGSSPAIGGGVFDVSFYIYLGKPFDVSIMPLIAPLAWAPHCCLQLYLGVKQRSCETPIVFIRFPIIITILPLESMAGKKSGVIWCRGGAIINKIAFLLISLLIQKSPFRTHQTVAQSVETWPGNRRVDGSSPAIGGGDFDVSFYIYLGKPFDVSIMPLIAPLAWAPHCCLQLYLGVKQRSCETPIVFIHFPVIITILPLESMAAHRTPCSKVMKFGTLF